MKKFFFFAAAALASVAVTAQNIEVCALDSAKLASLAGSAVATKTYTEAAITAGTVFFDGTNMTVKAATDQTYQWVSAAQPNGAHKVIAIGNESINMTEAMQGKDNPKDADGGNPCNTLIEPTQGAFFQITAKADGYAVVLHKATSNKQYFVFENSHPLGYSFGMMTYADVTLGNNGLIQYTLEGDAEYNYLTVALLEEKTGFSKIAFAEDYVNDTLTSGVAWETYKQNGVSAIAFKVYKDCVYAVGGAGTKMTAAAIVFVNGNSSALDIVAKGESITEDGATEPTVYSDVTLLSLAPFTALNNVEGSVKAQKVIRNGQVLIVKDGVYYTVLGTVAE